MRESLVVAAILLRTLAAALPSCDETFKYAPDSAGNFYGRLKFENDLSGTYDLQVEISIPTSTDEKLQIVRETSDEEVENGGNIIYSFTFPLKHRAVGRLPDIALIKFNKNEYCKSFPAKEATILKDSNTFSSASTVAATRPQSNSQSSWPQATNSQASRPQSTNSQSSWPQSTNSQASRPQSTNSQSSWPQSTNSQASRPQLTSSLSSPSSWRSPFTRSNASRDCGLRKEVHSVQLILNGAAVQEGQFPWMVALMYYEVGRFNYRCAGTLVSERHVITAAHCVHGGVERRKIFVVLGRLNIKYWADESSTFRYAEKIIVHPDFVRVSDGDVAVIVLDFPVKTTDLIRPACLWSEPFSLNDIYDEKGWIAGWGKDQSGKLGDEPKQIVIPIVKEGTCVRSHPNFRTLTSERTFCAGEGDGRIPCMGDSGSGFMMKRKGKWTLGGVVSAALSEGNFCHGGHYAVFADIPKYNT